MRVVYVDVLFFLNLAINYLLLLLTARCGGIYASRLRLLSGAALGALFAVLLYFPPMHFVMACGVKIVLCMAIVAVTFGKTEKHVFLRTALLFTIISFVFAGGMAAISYLSPLGASNISNGVPYFNISLKFLLFSVIIIYCVLGFVLGNNGLGVKQSFAEIKIQIGDKYIFLKALQDTGNMLRDPISGKMVMIVSASAAMNLFNEREQDIISRIKPSNVIESFEKLTKTDAGRFRLIPCSSIENLKGMIIAVKADSITVNGKTEEKYILGISPTSIEMDNGCRAIMGV